MRYVNEKEQGKGTVFWNEEGDAFIIKEISDFSNIIPKYFKTKNYASFIRQLNLYGFIKQKNKQGYHEFKNPLFKQHDTSKLLEIRRKQAECEEQEITQDTLQNKYDNLKKDYQESKNTLDFVSNQNKRLTDENSELLNKLNHMNDRYKGRIKKVLFIFYICSYYHDPVIEKELLKKLKNIGIDKIEEELLDDSDFVINKLTTIIKRLSDKLIYNNEDNDAVLDEIILFLKKFLTEKLNLKEVEINWKEMARTLFSSEKSALNINEYSDESERIQIFVPNVIRSRNPFQNNFGIKNNNKQALSFSSRNGSIFNGGSLNEQRERINKSFEEDNNSETNSLRHKQLPKETRNREYDRF